MSGLVLDRKAYAAAVDEPEELLDPIPQCALASAGAALLPFQLMLPDGRGNFVTTFGPIEDPLYTDGCLVRYGNATAVSMRWASYQTKYLAHGDNLMVTLVIGNAHPATSESDVDQ